MRFDLKGLIKDKPTSALASRTTETPLSSSCLTQSFLSVFPLRSRAPFQRDSSYLLHTHMHTSSYQGARSRKQHLVTCWTSELPTTSQHHFPTRILPCNHTNIRIHTHTMPTHTDLYANDGARI